MLKCKLWKRSKIDKQDHQKKPGCAGAASETKQDQDKESTTNWNKAGSGEGLEELERVPESRKKGVLEYFLKWARFDEQSSSVNVDDKQSFQEKKAHADAASIVEDQTQIISSIPNEVLAMIFCMLDRISFSNCRIVCKNWLSATQMIQPELDLAQLTKMMRQHFGDDWFSKHLIGNMPTSWNSYPFFPLHFNLASDLIAESEENVYVMYPAAWKGDELTAVGIIWKEEEGIQRDAVLQRTNYWNENGRMRGLAACCRKAGKKRSFGQFQHWHQAHGRLSMADHLDNIPKDSNPIKLEKIESLLNKKRRLGILHTWYDIQSGVGPDIPI